MYKINYEVYVSAVNLTSVVHLSLSGSYFYIIQTISLLVTNLTLTNFEI